MELIGGAIGIKAYTALRQGTKIYTIADDKPLLNYLSGMTCLIVLMIGLSSWWKVTVNHNFYLNM